MGTSFKEGQSSRLSIGLRFNDEEHELRANKQDLDEHPIEPAFIGHGGGVGRHDGARRCTEFE